MVVENYRKVKTAVPPYANICIVSKRRSEEEILSYYEVGERIFAENRTDELKRKYNDLPKDIRWQYIGHLQRNKAKDIIPFVDCIQSLDNLALANVIEKEAAKIDKVQNVLVEFHMAEEDTNKTGLTKEDAFTFMDEVMKFEHINVIGMMAMGPHTEDESRIREVFEETHTLFETLKEKYGEDHMHVLSMGMSDDYEIALSCGSTMVRIGTYLFEE